MKTLASSNLHFSGMRNTRDGHQINRMITGQCYKENKGTPDKTDGTDPFVGNHIR